MKLKFIDNAMDLRHIVIFIVSILVLLGVYGLVKMPKNEFPTVTVRQGIVIGVYPGATSAEVDEQLTKPLEDFIFGFKEVKKSKVISQSRDGMVYIKVELNDNVYDKDEFWSKFRHSLEAYKSSLPSGVLALVVQDDFGDTSAMLVTIESQQKTYHELEDYLDELKSRLRKIDAVSNLRSYGLQKEQISVYIDQEKMASYSINTAMIAAELASQGMSVMGSSVDNSSIVAPIHINRNLTTEKDVAEQIVYNDIDGRVVRLKDVARIVREYPDADSYITNNGTKAILLSMEMREGNNIVQMGKDVDKVLKRFERELPDDVSIYRITDQSQVVGDSISDFLRELLIAIVAVVLVVMVMMPLRVAWVAASSIPITIFISLGLFYLFAIELNTVTLAALIVTLGMIVDNSVVIIDSYLEMLDNGIPRREAATASAKEFFKSILSATLAISITFFPFLFATRGMIKDFLLLMPWAISIILFISLLVAVMLIPAIQYGFIKRGLKQASPEGSKKNSLIEHIQTFYNRIIGACFAHPSRTIAISIAIVVCGGWLLTVLPQKMMPVAQRNQFAVEIYLPNGSPIEKTAAVASQVENGLKNDDRIVSITSFIGSASPRFHSAYAPQIPGSNYAQFIVNTTGSKATDELLDEYAMKYYDAFPEAIVKFKQLEYNDAANPIEVRLSGNDFAQLKEYAQKVEDVMRSTDNLIMVRSDLNGTTPGVVLNLDNEEMNRLGIPSSSVSLHNFAKYGGGIPVTTVWEEDYPVGVVLKADREGEVDYSSIGNERISGYGGAVSVPMRQIAEVEPDWTDGQIVRRNGVPTITVMAGVVRGENSSQAEQELRTEISKMDFPTGIDIAYGGDSEFANDVIPQIMGALVLAVAIILFILLFHFKNLSISVLVLLSAILFGLPGTSFGIWVMGYEICVTSFLGIISLMGIVVRNGIILIDYANELMAEGESVRSAVLHSAERRMRPIFLTSAAASMGVVPMILSGSALWSPMGVVVFFGTWISMCFVLTVFPVLYWKLWSKEEKKSDVEFAKR